MASISPHWYFMGFPPTYIAAGIENREAYVRSPHLVAMVGLPGRGKTCTAKKLSRYLNWIEIKSKVFTFEESLLQYHRHDSMSQSNQNMEHKCIMKTLQEICTWLESGGEVAVLDSDNLTVERRSFIYDVIVKQMALKLFFIELICTDRNLMKYNIRLSNAVGQNSEESVLDFMNKIEHSEKMYQEIDHEKESHLSYMKIFDFGKQIIVHKHKGHIQGRIIYFVINTKVIPHIIYLTRHGESEMNVKGRIGGDSSLSEQGQAFALALAEYVQEEDVPRGLRVWTSWMKRAIQTAAHIKLPQERWKALNEINAGICEGLTYDEIKQKHPLEFEARAKDKYNYRYPNGESYKDVIGRLEPIIMEMERQGNILVVTHQSIMRCLLGFFLNKPADVIPVLKVPLHTIFKLTIDSSGLKLEEIKIPIEAASVQDFAHLEPVPVGTLSSDHHISK